MNYRQHRGIRLSEVGLGCYGLGGAYGPVNVSSYRKVIQRAFDMGVNFFDTAAAYGNAEQLLGEAISPFRDEVIVATKIDVGSDGQSNLTAQSIRQSCEKSLKALDTDYIDLLQIHYDDPHAGIEEVLGTMEALVMAGKIRWYGIGHLPFSKISTYCKAGNLFSVMIELSAVAREARDYILPKCRDNNIAALAFSVTGRGVLSGSYRPGYRFPDDDIRRIDPLFQRERWRGALRVRDKLARVGLRYSKTAIQMGIAWVLAQSGVSVALTGPSSILHLAENLAISGWKFPREELEALESFFRLEDARLRQEQHAGIRSLLLGPLTDDRKQAFRDLVYILETTLLLHLIDEQTVMPLYKDLIQSRTIPEEQALHKMTEIHDYLREIITPKGV